VLLLLEISAAAAGTRMELKNVSEMEHEETGSKKSCSQSYKNELKLHLLP